MDSASDRVLTQRRGAGRARLPGRPRAGRERLERLGLEHKVLPAAGTSEDVAMLVAFERGASLIVASAPTST